jgi:hypothetical protein
MYPDLGPTHVHIFWYSSMTQLDNLSSPRVPVLAAMIRLHVSFQNLSMESKLIVLITQNRFKTDCFGYYYILRMLCAKPCP